MPQDLQKNRVRQDSLEKGAQGVDVPRPDNVDVVSEQPKDDQNVAKRKLRRWQALNPMHSLPEVHQEQKRDEKAPEKSSQSQGFPEDFHLMDET